MWLAFVCTGASPLAILAQTASVQLPAKFGQVFHLEEITGDCSYVLGTEYAVHANGKDNEGFCLLTNRTNGSNLCGVTSQYPVPSVLEIEDEGSIWNLQYDKGAYVLYSPSLKKGVALKKKSTTSLVMSASGMEKWQLNEVGKGVFVLQSLTDESRALGLNWFNDNKIFFGLYKINGNNPTRLRIYKQIVNAFDLPGEATKPADGSHVAVAVKNRVLTLNSGHIEFVEDSLYRLENGFLVQEPKIPNWICQHSENDAFRLVNESGEGLEQFVEGLSEQMQWKIDEGYLVTDEQPERYLALNGEGNVILRTHEQLADEKLTPILLIPISDAPKFTSDGKGTKLLQGGWSAYHLSDIEWGDALVLDLTQIKLPLGEVHFKHRPERSNAVVLVSEQTKVNYLQHWKNVVLCSEKGTAAWRNQDELNDRELWYIDRDIKLNKGQLTYYRSAFTDGKWETLCIPFKAKVPENFEVSRFSNISEDNILLFERSREIQPDEPVLIRYVGSDKADKVDLKLSSEEGILKPYFPSHQGFSGTYAPLYVKSSDENVYLLNSEGNTFVRAAEGSRLSPFRAAFYGTDVRAVMNFRCVEHEETGISSVEHTEKGQACYTLDGRLVLPDFTSEDFERLPKGIYIIGGKKYLK